MNMNFTESIREKLTESQRLLDLYQVECFTARAPNFFALELCGEAGELANKEKKLWKGKSIEPEALAEEAADVFIALINYSSARGIALGKAVEEKLLEIERRRLAGTH